MPCSRQPAAARARARWGRHPCLPVRAASLPPVSMAEQPRRTGNTGQGCPANWQARMPAPPGWRRRQAACQKLSCARGYQCDAALRVVNSSTSGAFANLSVCRRGSPPRADSQRGWKLLSMGRRARTRSPGALAGRSAKRQIIPSASADLGRRTQAWKPARPARPRWPSGFRFNPGTAAPQFAPRSRPPTRAALARCRFDWPRVARSRGRGWRAKRVTRRRW